MPRTPRPSNYEEARILGYYQQARESTTGSFTLDCLRPEKAKALRTYIYRYINCCQDFIDAHRGTEEAEYYRSLVQLLKQYHLKVRGTKLVIQDKLRDPEEEFIRAQEAAAGCDGHALMEEFKALAQGEFTRAAELRRLQAEASQRSTVTKDTVERISKEAAALQEQLQAEGKRGEGPQLAEPMPAIEAFMRSKPTTSSPTPSEVPTDADKDAALKSDVPAPPPSTPTPTPTDEAAELGERVAHQEPLNLAELFATAPSSVPSRSVPSRSEEDKS